MARTIAPLYEYAAHVRFLSPGPEGLDQPGPLQRRYFSSARFAFEWISKLERADGRRVFYTISRREVGNWEAINYAALEADAAAEGRIQ